MIETSRRSLITGLAALVAAPAIVKVASIMPVNSKLVPGYGNNLLTINRITRDAVRLFQNSNEFLKEIDRQYDDLTFTLRVRPEWQVVVDDRDMSGVAINARYQAQLAEERDWASHRTDQMYYEGMQWSQREMDQMRTVQRAINDARGMVGSLEQAAAPLALAATAVVAAPEILAKPVTRRFWGK